MTDYFVTRTLLTFYLINSILLGIAGFPLQTQPPLCREIIVGPGSRTLDCSVGRGEYLDYRTIRTMTSLTDGINYNLTITCDGGRIYLPWPFRASHVTVLNVRNCGIDGFLSEFNTANDLPNTIEILSLENIKTKIELKDLLSVLTNVRNISKKNECGQVNARQQKYVNIESEFSMDTASFEEMMKLDQLLATDALKQDFLTTGGNCIFSNLEYLEESGSRSVSSIHFKLIESSVYPKLTEYVVANNSLSRVPRELRNLALTFLPKIEKLDLSYNSISELEFIYPRAYSTGKQLYIDLRENLISLTDGATVNNLIQSNGVVFDLRENPLQCVCPLYQYGQYLIGQGYSTVYYGLSCWTMQGGVRKLHYVSEPEFRNKFCMV